MHLVLQVMQAAWHLSFPEDTHLSNAIQYHVIWEGNFSLGSLRKEGLWDHNVCQSSVTAFEPGQP